MPVISRFYGIIIRMYFQQAEHNLPHIHAIYGDDMSAISIMSGEVMEGKIPPKALLLVREWLNLHRKELLIMWDSQEFKKIAPLE